jgi:hypothetical protein
MKTIVFIHGWSVTSMDTYGGLPVRLAAEAQQKGIDLDLQHIFLSRYISFHDEVTLADIARAFQAALDERPELTDFICITHSTGGPVVRQWWNSYYSNARSPISHLIMLAPANFGSALAQLGKGKLGRIKSFFEGVEPGQNVLNWLELGSHEAWVLNQNWITDGAALLQESGTLPFVLIGQSIDRSIYDHLNSYTGELGSDGVVRTAGANLNAQYVRLTQNTELSATNKTIVTPTLASDLFKESPKTPMRVLSKKSHSGTTMGIMASISDGLDDPEGVETVAAIFNCIKVDSLASYAALANQFDAETAIVQAAERIEKETELFLFEKTFIHDLYSQVIFRVKDHLGYPITDYDLILTAGEDNNPNHLPSGFALDRQKNLITKNTITYYFNYTVMSTITKLGLKIQPRPDEGFVRYFPCEIVANEDLFTKAIQPNRTTLIDIVLHRAISKEVFRIEPTTATTLKMDFEATNWDGKPII